MTAVAPSPQTTLVILLGASRWPFSPEFQASKAFLNSMMEVREYFLNPSEFGLPQENVLNLFNSNQSSDDIDGEMGHFIERRMTEMKQRGEVARDLLVYFIGHGGFVGNDSDFYLAIRRTRTDNPGASAIRMMSLAYTLKEKARYLRRIVILDCCFAGAAFLAFQSDPAQTAILQTVDAFRVQGKGSGVPERGTSLLCSSRHNTPSLISQDGSHTLFSQALVRALSTGNPRRPDPLSLRAIAELTEDVLDTMPEQSVPRPEVHSPDQVDGGVADVPLFPNGAVKGVRSSHTLPSQTSQPMQMQPQPSHASRPANASLSQQAHPSQSTSASSSSSQRAHVPSSPPIFQDKPVKQPASERQATPKRPDEKVNIWKIGKRQVVAAIICIVLFGVLDYVLGTLFSNATSNSPLFNPIGGLSFSPYSLGVLYGLIFTVPLFFAVEFGPWVGLASAVIGALLGDYAAFHSLPFLWYAYASDAIFAFIPGLALFKTRGRYDNWRAITIAVIMSAIGIIVGTILVAICDSIASPQVVLFNDFLTLTLSAIPTLILLPILLFIYNRIVNRGKSPSTTP